MLEYSLDSYKELKKTWTGWSKSEKIHARECLVDDLMKRADKAGLEELIKNSSEYEFFDDELEHLISHYYADTISRRKAYGLTKDEVSILRAEYQLWLSDVLSDDLVSEDWSTLAPIGRCGLHGVTCGVCDSCLKWYTEWLEL